LTEWLAHVDTPYGWVSLDERDNEIDVFLGYVLAAVRTAFPTIAQDTRDLLSAATPPPLAAVANSLSNDLDRLDAQFLLVLDDYQVISNPQIHELLLQVLQHPPAMLHLIVATRSDPPWSLATLRARGQMAELRFPDLQFTSAESATLLHSALGGTLHGDVIATLHDESEGWAAGLQLMTLVLHGEEITQPQRLQLPAATEDIGAYLLAEVLSKQTPADEDRLLQMSIRGRFSASLCEAVCTRDAAQSAVGDGPEGWGREFLTRLDHDNLFIISLDAHHEFYRFHHLFQQFLADRLTERSSAKAIVGLHRRASAWFAAQGFIEEALDHALAAGETEAAAQLVARHRYALYNHEQFARLARWLRLLPATVKEHTPELLLAEARIATMNWRYTEAAVFLDRAEQELAKRGPEQPDADALKGELVTLRGILQFWDGDAERFLAAARYALEALPAEASHLRGLAHTGIAAGLYLLGDAQSARAYLDDQLASVAPQLPVYAWLLQTSGFLHWLDGDLTSLQDAARRLLRVSESLELPDLQATAHYFLGAVHYARNELAAAEEQLERAVAARFTMRLLWWCQAAGVLGLTYLALGRPEDAQQTLEDGHAFLLEQHAVRILPNIGAYQAEVNRLQHRLVEATTWAAGVDPLPLTWSLAVVDPRLVQVRVFLSQGRATSLEQAGELLAQLRAYCDQVPNRRLLMEVEALAALLNASRGESERALEMLERVVLTAETDGWVRLFVDLGPGMERLLTHLAARGIAPHYIAHILAAFPVEPATITPRGPAVQSPLIDLLSERELEVLTLLAQRYSNKEIAERLFIAPATVKHHTINIYQKLDVSDRRQAVAQATALGLLPEA
jgi:LuxR family maltose regulon positive regulatory protein